MRLSRFDIMKWKKCKFCNKDTQRGSGICLDCAEERRIKYQKNWNKSYYKQDDIKADKGIRKCLLNHKKNLLS